jgi:hypothetical protein
MMSSERPTTSNGTSGVLEVVAFFFFYFMIHTQHTKRSGIYTRQCISDESGVRESSCNVWNNIGRDSPILSYCELVGSL